MISNSMYSLGAKRSCIRELFEYGLQQAKVVGKENVMDFSIGNPSIPTPDAVTQAFDRLVLSEDTIAVHGYTPAPGDFEARKAVADNLTRRTRTQIRPENIFFTCGAAPALISSIRALAVEDAEIMVIAPYFPEYRPFIEMNGCKFVVVPPDTHAFQIRFDELESASRRTRRRSSSTPPTTPPAWSIRCRRFRSWRSCSTERAARSAIPSTSSRTSPIASWSMTVWTCPICPTSIRIRSSAIPIQNPLSARRAHRLCLRAGRCGGQRRAVHRHCRRLPHGRPRLRALASAEGDRAVRGRVAQSGGL